MSDLPAGLQRRDFDGDSSLATRGDSVYGEATADGWRAWDPRRSKLAAMIELGMDTGLQAGATVLYLGAAAGTTVSHVADFAGPTYAVEFAPRPIQQLLSVAESRPRLFPLFKDARDPDGYSHIVESDVDAVIQDVATRGQADVALRNRRFLSQNGRLITVIKARSEDVTAAPSDVFSRATTELATKYELLETQRLEPYHDDHLAVIATPD